MHRRIIALLLACLLIAGMPCALSEAVEIAVDPETGGVVFEDGAGAVADAVMPCPDGVALPIDSLASNFLSNDVDDADAQPVELSVSQSGTRRVTLGLSYQIVVPGKTVKTCKSDNKKVATVTKQGLIQTKKAGTAKITVTPAKGSKLKLTLKVTDPKVPTAVVIAEGASATMNAGETLQLTAVVSPDTAPQKVAWKSSDKSVATVDQDGLVTALKKGSATITATTDNKLTAKLKLTVRKALLKPCVIAHAMGGIDGDAYTNSLEAFQANYALGHRIFEVDTHFTSDGKLVLWHSWDYKFCSKHTPGYKPTYKEFMGSKIYDRYTPMDLKKLLKLMDKYTDVRIVLDGKYGKIETVKRQYKLILSTAKDLKLTRVLDRMIVEIYNEEMYSTVKKIYPFQEYMMALYKIFMQAPTEEDFEQVARFCEQSNIRTIVMDILWEDPRYIELAAAHGVKLSYYTVNDAEQAQSLFDEGVIALFTDFLPPV